MEEQTKKTTLINSRTADDGDFGNTISFVGNLGRDPEMKYTGDGVAQTKFSVAVWAGKNQTMWLNVVLWEDLAEEATEKLNKGTRVKVVGRLRSYKWSGQDRFEVTGSWIEILIKPEQVVEPVKTEKSELWAVIHSDNPYTPY
jgi:single stranded DNA-binding protein